MKSQDEVLVYKTMQDYFAQCESQDGILKRKVQY